MHYWYIFILLYNEIMGKLALVHLALLTDLKEMGNPLLFKKKIQFLKLEI